MVYSLVLKGPNNVVVTMADKIGQKDGRSSGRT